MWKNIYANKNIDLHSYVISIHNFSPKPACDLHSHGLPYMKCNWFSWKTRHHYGMLNTPQPTQLSTIWCFFLGPTMQLCREPCALALGFEFYPFWSISFSFSKPKSMLIVGTISKDNDFGFKMSTLTMEHVIFLQNMQNDEKPHCMVYMQNHVRWKKCAKRQMKKVPYIASWGRG
jgi:hypothetical protein